jgi:hypothetical protein
MPDVYKESEKFNIVKNYSTNIQYHYDKIMVDIEII